MAIEQNTEKMEASFVRKVRDQLLAWAGVVGGALKSLPKLRFNRTAPLTNKYLWAIFAMVIVGNIVGFNYYQERITRYYLGVLLTNIVRMNDDIDALDAKLNKLNAKIDDLSAKLDKRPQLPLSIPAVPQSSSLAKPRSK